MCSARGLLRPNLLLSRNRKRAEDCSFGPFPIGERDLRPILIYGRGAAVSVGATARPVSTARW